MLLLTALIWGSAFVAQSVGTEYLGAFTFNAARSFVAGIALLPVIFFSDRAKAGRGEAKPHAEPAGRKALVWGGVACGVVLTVAAALQQLGIAHTTVGKSGFITALYIVLVPIIGIFLKKRAHFTVWLSVALALVGLYFLCITEGFSSIQKGDLLMLACAVAYSGHILVIDHFSPKVDCLRMSCIQFFVCGALSSIVMLIAETPTWEGIFAATIPILYTGVLSSGVGYTLQMIAQKNTQPAVASLLMSLESVFAVLAGWALLGQALSGREILGCALMFAAILLAQTPDFLAGRAAHKPAAQPQKQS